MQQLAVGREGDGFGCTVVSTVTRLRSRLRSDPASCATLRLSATRGSNLSPKRLRHPAIAHAFVGEAINVLEQQQPNHEAGLDLRAALVAVQRCNLRIDPIPVDLAGELRQLVLHVDDLIEPGTNQIAFLVA